MNRRAVTGLTAAVALCGTAALLGFGIVGDTTTTPMLPSTPAPAVSPATHTRIAIAGDTGTGPGSAIEATVQTMVDQSRQRDYNGLVLLGDLIYPEGDADQARSTITDVFAPVTSRGARLVPVLGNHDYMSDEQSTILTEVGRERTWYAERVGIVRIIVLDTEQVDSPAQATWLQETLASPTDAAWTIVAMHKPAHSAGVHGSDAAIQHQWVPLFEQYDIPLVLAGHDHDYHRSKPIAGVTYVISGGAATLRPTGHQDFTEISTSTLHYVDLLAEDDRLTLRAIDQSGMLFDSFELSH
ncbi:acid phosphatase [Nocardioides flavus (ex Wang et al. 2016)]|uniref:Acid phosphatase n=1 Tax=Nocardioides flavus (ex Wang et al. 2016) TaxID=2058780 RepID=A0ABQ3HQE5_9ACTN|nr:metallophosphoesterase [Nocardioides flavus (ex Wang et al. 2016)]GHE18916.1 acid phosphatase [Nocardioides flavus (ex Wang et al. 2016)]